jgi:hypothetical protein
MERFVEDLDRGRKDLARGVEDVDQRPEMMLFD